MEETICCICSNKLETYQLDDEVDINTRKMVEMLRYCVPEIDWSTSNLICHKCLAIVKDFCNFKNLCIKANLPKKKIFRTKIIRETYTNEREIEESETNEKTVSPSNKRRNASHKHKPFYYDSTNWKYECNACHKKFLFEAHLRTHVNSEHRDRSTKYICKRCHKSFPSQLILATHISLYHSPKKRSIYDEPIKEKTHTKKSKKRKLKINDDAVTVKRLKPTTTNLKEQKTITTFPENNTETSQESQTKDQKTYDDYTKTIVKAFFQSKHNTKKYSCGLCGKTSIKASNLSRHMKIHDSRRVHKRDRNYDIPSPKILQQLAHIYADRKKKLDIIQQLRTHSNIKCKYQNTFTINMKDVGNSFKTSKEPTITQEFTDTLQRSKSEMSRKSSKNNL